jgi:hypothetical protein
VKGLANSLTALLLAVCLGGCGEKSEEPAREQEDKQTYAGQMLGALDRAAMLRTKLDLQSLGSALRKYSSSRRGFPVASDATTLKGLLVPTYTRRFPEHDQWGRPLQVQSSETTYKIVAPGADGVVGTDDDFVLGPGHLTLPKNAPDFLK